MDLDVNFEEVEDNMEVSIVNLIVGVMNIYEYVHLILNLFYFWYEDV